MNPALMSSSEGGSQVFAQVVKAILEFVKRHVERRNRVEAAVGLVGKDVSVLHGFEGDGIVEIAVSTGAGADLVKRVLKVHHVIDIGHFLVLAEKFGVNGFAIAGRQSEVEEDVGFLWLVEHGHVLRSETDGGHGRPLGVVPASSEDSKGVEFQELAFGEHGQGDLLVLITNVKHRVGNGGDVAGVYGFEVFFSV